jgi:hypothetical protein
MPEEIKLSSRGPPCSSIRDGHMATIDLTTDASTFGPRPTTPEARIQLMHPSASVNTGIRSYCGVNLIRRGNRFYGKSTNSNGIPRDFIQSATANPVARGQGLSSCGL